MPAYADAGGDGVRTGVLFRVSGGLVTTDDLAALRASGVRTYVDLRGEHEDRDAIVAWAAEAGVRYVHAPIEAGSIRDTLAQAATEQPLDPVYRSIVDGSGAQLARAVAAIADGAPAAVGCTAGKDRTGVVVAIVQRLLGVPEPTVIERYGSDAPSVDELGALVEQHSAALDGLPADVVRAALATSPAAARTALGAVDAAGGPSAYLSGHGLTPAAERRLRDALLP